MLKGPYLSTAVLTPEQIHPNFFKMKKTHPHVQIKRVSKCNHLAPLSSYDIEHRKRWAKIQIIRLENIQSNAVLGA